jgi:NDP-sugar pyrophosphorylase family protein
MTIIIPIAGTVFFEDNDLVYPKPLIDVGDKPLIEYVINNLKTISPDIKFCFILKNSLCTEYNLDSTILQIEPGATVIKLKKETKGSLCTVLMALGKIDENEEVIICNSDQIFLTDLNFPLNYFKENSADAGIITFNSVHPRWSFALIEDNLVMETAEKKSISKNAIAGFYYYKSYSTFVEAGFNSVINEDYHNNQIYVSSSINQLVLKNKKVFSFKIKNEDFLSFYTPQKIKEFERNLTNFNFTK